jgi:hypothetical protein
VLPLPPPAPPDWPITVCAVVNGVPQYVEAFVRPQEGDTVVVTPQGIRRPLRVAYPVPPTASGRDWFVRDEPIFFDRHEYVRRGVPRVLTSEEINRIGEYQEFPSYAPRDGPGRRTCSTRRYGTAASFSPISAVPSLFLVAVARSGRATATGHFRRKASTPERVSSVIRAITFRSAPARMAASKGMASCW